jgi:hypothetical protein
VAGKDSREVELVILTDRVDLPEENMIREWNLHEPLHPMALPVKFKGSLWPVYLIANRPEHWSSMAAVGAAMVNMAAVHEADWSRPNTDYRAQRAYRAQNLVAAARTELIQDWRDGLLDQAVFLKLQRCLDQMQGKRAPFTKDWEIGAAFCGALALDSLGGHAGEMRCRFFGRQLQSSGLIRIDRHRAGLFMDAIKAGRDSELIRAPKNHLAKLTDKYLNALLPMMLPGYKFRNLGLVDEKSVSLRDRLVTQENQKMGHEKHHRPLGAFA